jgi:hypothetical protein
MSIIGPRRVPPSVWFQPVPIRVLDPQRILVGCSKVEHVVVNNAVQRPVRAVHRKINDVRVIEMTVVNPELMVEIVGSVYVKHPYVLLGTARPDE